MIDLIDLDRDGVPYIVIKNSEVRVMDPMLDILFRSSKEVINHYDFVTHEHQPIH